MDVYSYFPYCDFHTKKEEERVGTMSIGYIPQFPRFKVQMVQSSAKTSNFDIKDFIG